MLILSLCSCVSVPLNSFLSLKEIDGNGGLSIWVTRVFFFFWQFALPVSHLFSKLVLFLDIKVWFWLLILVYCHQNLNGFVPFCLILVHFNKLRNQQFLGGLFGSVGGLDGEWVLEIFLKYDKMISALLFY